MKGYMSVEELIDNPMVGELIETVWDPERASLV
jgi:hypothetical protein